MDRRCRGWRGRGVQSDRGDAQGYGTKTCRPDRSCLSPVALVRPPIPVEHLQRAFCEASPENFIDARFRHLRLLPSVFIPESDEQFVRDAFDELFDGLERLELFVRINLIQFSDIENALVYYVKRMAQPEEQVIVTKFLTAYEFELAPAFLERFPVWQDQISSARQASDFQ